MYKSKKAFFKEHITEILAVALGIIEIGLIISLIVIWNKEPTPTVHSEFYNDIAENVQLPCEEWNYYHIDCDLDSSVIEIGIATDTVDGSQINDIATSCENLYNYIRLKKECNKCDITIKFRCSRHAGTSFHFYVTYHEFGDVDIASDWSGVDLDSIAEHFSEVNNVIMRLFYGDYISHNMKDLSNYKKFSNLKSIMLIGFRFTEDEEAYILSVFPECDITYENTTPDYLI